MHNLLGVERAALAEFFVARGEKAFRAEQIFRRLHADCQNPPDAFADLPKPLRREVQKEFFVAAPSPAQNIRSRDGVQKLLFALSSASGDGPGGLIESVIIPETRRQTLCVSSQVGCALACRFCRTGTMGFWRNLNTAEIISQLRCANRLSADRRKMTNVVMMGMGEPLLNLPALLPALRMMTDPAGYALSPRRVTVSTAGVVPAMARLREEAAASLAVSLHAAADSLRDELMPINKKYPLHSLLEACRLHVQDKKRVFVTFEYVMLRGINDSAACARDLARLLHGVRCKVNLIPFNTFAGAPYTATSMDGILAFRDKVMRGGIMTTIRKTRGDDILAACGQLADVHSGFAADGSVAMGKSLAAGEFSLADKTNRRGLADDESPLRLQ